MSILRPILGSALLGTYSAVWRAATPLLRHHKRLREGFAQRLVPSGWPFFCSDEPQSALPETPASSTNADAPHAKGQCLWIQAASGGEAWLANTLVEEILAQRTATSQTLTPLTIVCTTCTRQGLDVLEKLHDRVAEQAEQTNTTYFACYFPLDTPSIMERALQQAAPDMLVLLETELWPGLMAAAKKHAVPVIVVNGRMTEKSLNAYKYMRFFWQENAPKGVLAMSEKDAARFTSLFGNIPVRVMQNIKFDRVATSLDNANDQESEPTPTIIRQYSGIAPTTLLAVFASTREEEEKLLLPAIEKLHAATLLSFPVSIVLAPRHLHRVPFWQEALTAAGIPYILRSEQQAYHDNAAGDHPYPMEAGTPEAPVYLWDTFGELRHLYRIADAVFVGGSLAPLGGQNFLEPLAEGVRPVVGKYLDNFHWVSERLQYAKAAKTTSTPSSAIKAPATGSLDTDILQQDSFLCSLVLAPEDILAVMETSLTSRASEIVQSCAVLKGAQHPLDGATAGRYTDPTLDFTGQATSCLYTSLEQARERVVQKTRAPFAAWLATRTGGTAQAATMILRVLQKAQSS